MTVSLVTMLCSARKIMKSVMSWVYFFFRKTDKLCLQTKFNRVRVRERMWCVRERERKREREGRVKEDGNSVGKCVCVCLSFFCLSADTA